MTTYHYNTALDALRTLISDMEILSGDTVGPSDASWQDVAGTAELQARRLANQLKAAREANLPGEVAFPSPNDL